MKKQETEKIWVCGDCHDLVKELRGGHNFSICNYRLSKNYRFMRMEGNPACEARKGSVIAKRASQTQVSVEEREGRLTCYGCLSATENCVKCINPLSPMFHKSTGKFISPDTPACMKHEVVRGGELAAKAEDKTRKPAPPEIKWKVFIGRRIFEELLYYSRLSAPNEIQFVAEVEKVDNVFRFTKLYLLKQRVSPASADFDLQALADFLVHHPHPENLHGWCHSHVQMGVFWSGIDAGTIHDLTGTAGWLVSVVLTTNGALKARLDVSVKSAQKRISELKHRNADLDSILMIPEIVTWSDLPITIEDYLPAEDKARMEAEFNEKVGVRTPSYTIISSTEPQKDLWPQAADYLGAEIGVIEGAPIDESAEIFGNPDLPPEEELICDYCAYDLSNTKCKKNIPRNEKFIRKLSNGKTPSCYSPRGGKQT
jgi:hypothetical protein